MPSNKQYILIGKVVVIVFTTALNLVWAIPYINGYFAKKEARDRAEIYQTVKCITDSAFNQYEIKTNKRMADNLLPMQNRLDTTIKVLRRHLITSATKSDINELRINIEMLSESQKKNLYRNQGLLPYLTKK